MTDDGGENGRLLRVLLVEDSEDDALLLTRQLRKGGIEVDCERVWERTDLDRLLEQQEWDIVLSDYRLPGFSALEVIAAVQERGLDLPVIIVSGAIGEESAVEAMHAGAHDYVMKDNLARLVPAIERELEEMEVHRERREAAAALRESQEHFSELARNIGGVLWLIDCATEKMVYVSDSYERLWDHPMEPLFEDLDRFLDTVHPEDYDRIAEVLAEEGWKGFNEEYRIQRMDGEVRWMHTRSFPIRDEAGAVYRIAGLSTDVTNRKRLEDEMKTLSRALEQSADAVMITDARGVIQYINPSFEDVTGYSRQEVIGRDPRFLKSGFHDHAFYRRLWETLRAGLPFSEIFINRRKDGELYYEAQTITPVRDEYGDVVHFVATGKDITERLRQQKPESGVLLHDPSTGLATRAYFMDRLERVLERARAKEERTAVFTCRVDLSGLLGGSDDDGAVRDELRLQVVRRLLRFAPHADAVTRLGGEEFALALETVADGADAERFANDVLEAFRRPVAAEGYELHVLPHLGISLFPDHAEDATGLLDQAHVALEYAAGASRAGFRLYEPDMQPPADERRTSHRYLSD